MLLNQINSKITADKNGSKTYCNRIFSSPDISGSKVAEKAAFKRKVNNRKHATHCRPYMLNSPTVSFAPE